MERDRTARHAGHAGATGPSGARGATGSPGPATGPAGGDLAGSYPNPTIGAAAITNGNIAAHSVSSNDFDPSAIAPNAAELGGMPASGYLKATGQWLTDRVDVASGSTGTLFGGGGVGPADNITVTADCGSPDMGVSLVNDSDDVATVFTTVSERADSEQTVNDFGAATGDVGSCPPTPPTRWRSTWSPPTARPPSSPGTTPRAARAISTASC